MGQIWQAALTIIDSIGGAGVIILGVVKFTFVHQIAKKQSFQVSKEPIRSTALDIKKLEQRT